MTKILWKCSDEKLRKSNLFKFENFLKKKYGLNHKNNYEKLWKWTVENTAEFWKSIWEFSNVKGCLLYTSPSPRDLSTSRMPSSA